MEKIEKREETEKWNGAERFPACQEERLVLPGGILLGASVRGRMHTHEGSYRDDAFLFAAVEDMAAIAVSDGAGSKPFSRFGAETACNSAVGALEKALQSFSDRGRRRALEKGLASPDCIAALKELAAGVQNSVGAASSAISQMVADSRGKEPFVSALGREAVKNDFSSTLLVMAAIPIGEETMTVSCQIGDGCIAAVYEGEFSQSIKLLGSAVHGRYSGETEFITMEDRITRENLQRKTVVSCGKILALLLMTDGVSDDYFPPQTGLLRLYLDLQLNGGLNGRVYRYERSEGVRRKSCREIMEAYQITLKELWEQQQALFLLEPDQSLQEERPQEECLCDWLSSYWVRGSFDDRTLVAYLPKRSKGEGD